MRKVAVSGWAFVGLVAVSVTITTCLYLCLNNIQNISVSRETNMAGSIPMMPGRFGKIRELEKSASREQRTNMRTLLKKKGIGTSHRLKREQHTIHIANNSLSTVVQHLNVSGKNQISNSELNWQQRSIVATGYKDITARNLSDSQVLFFEKNIQNHSATDTEKEISTKQFTSVGNIISWMKNLFSFGNFSETTVKDTVTVPRCSFTDNGTRADCSKKNLTGVPKEGVPNTIIIFDISKNIITKLTDCIFQKYQQLQVLDLSSNIIYEIDELAFHGLAQLKVLNLWNNRWEYFYSGLSGNIFVPLSQLQELIVNNNTINCKNDSAKMNYPDQAMIPLTNLMSLYMDGLAKKEFGEGFQSLTQLVNLSLAGFNNGCCRVYQLHKTTFQYLPHLQNLNISNCFIDGNNIHPDAFSKLYNLSSLDLTHNEDIDLQNVDKVFRGLSGLKSLKTLNINLIVNRYSIGICLDSFYIRNFPQHLEHLSATENNLEGLDRRVIEFLPPSLKTLDVSGNRFVFGKYLEDLPLLKNLTILLLNGPVFTYNLPEIYPFNWLGPTPATSNCTLYDDRDAVGINYTDFILRLPPNLRVIEMNKAGLTYFLSKLNVDPNNSLEILNISHNYFPQLLGPFVGLPKLRHLGVSSSYVGYISEYFFQNLSSLTSLNLNSNLLGDFFSNQQNRNIFKDLSNLISLDLSFNDIRSFPKNVFSDLTSLEKLHLERNSLVEFTVDISRLNFLNFVNLTRNRIPTIPQNIRKDINSHLNRGQSFKVDMSECPISCTCENLDFLKWVKNCDVLLESPLYSCVYKGDLTKNIMNGYNTTIVSLLKTCDSHTLLFFLVSTAMMVIIFAILCAIIYRSRWKIMYMYYAVHLLCISHSKDTSSKYKYDAFISYAQEDKDFVVKELREELEKRDLTLCIHDRDFSIGEYIASNIFKAVCDSRRTLVVVTHNLVKSSWCRYEIQMANVEAAYKGRKVLLFLMMKNIPESDLKIELLYNISNNTHISYPDPKPNPTYMNLLWDKLAADIRD